VISHLYYDCVDRVTTKNYNFTLQDAGPSPTPVHPPLISQSCILNIPPYFHKISKFPPINAKCINFQLISFNLRVFCLFYIFCFPLFSPRRNYASCFTRTGRPSQDEYKLLARLPLKPTIILRCNNKDNFLQCYRRII